MKKSLLNKVIGDVEVTKDLSLLLVIGGLYSLSIALSNTFVNVYLWKQSGEFIDIALYNLAAVIFQPLTFILAGRLAKKVDRVIVLRLGVSSLSFFFFTVLFLGEKTSENLLLLGSLLGVGMGFYWLAFNVLTFEITEPETRDFFQWLFRVIVFFCRHDWTDRRWIYHYENGKADRLHGYFCDFSRAICPRGDFKLPAEASKCQRSILLQANIGRKAQ